MLGEEKGHWEDILDSERHDLYKKQAEQKSGTMDVKEENHSPTLAWIVYAKEGKEKLKTA